MRVPCLLCAALLALSACGADAPPLVPETATATPAKSGVSVTGDARIGVTANF
jgi:hypothetical protein